MSEKVLRGSMVLVVDLNGDRQVGFVWTAINYGNDIDTDWYVEWYEQKEPVWKGYHYMKEQIDHVTGFIFNYDPEEVIGWDKDGDPVRGLANYRDVKTWTHQAIL